MRKYPFNFLFKSTNILVPKIENPIFIISAPRSGSSYFYEIIRRTENTLSFETENSPMWFRFFPYKRQEQLSDYIGGEECQPKDITGIKSFIAAKSILNRRKISYRNARDIIFLRKHVEFYIEKTISNCFHLDAIEKVFPNARYIHLVRSPRPNISSMIEAWDIYVKTGIAIPNPETATIRHWAYAMPPNWQVVVSKPLAEICAWSWVEHNRYILDKLNSEQSFQDRYLKVSYEDLLAQPETVINKVCEFTDLRLTRAGYEYLNEKQLSWSTVSPPSPDKWKKKYFEAIQSVEPIFLPLSLEIGYETSRV